MARTLLKLFTFACLIRFPESCTLLEEACEDGVGLVQVSLLSSPGKPKKSKDREEQEDKEKEEEEKESRKLAVTKHSKKKVDSKADAKAVAKSTKKSTKAEAKAAKVEKEAAKAEAKAAKVEKEAAKAEAKAEAKALKTETKVAKAEAKADKAAKSKAKKMFSKIVRRDVDMLLSHLGMPEMMTAIAGGFLHDGIMDFRKTTPGRQEFVDYFFGEIGNLTQDELSIDVLLRAVYEASNHSHLDKPVREFIGELEPVLRPKNGTIAQELNPQLLMQVLGKGLGKMGVPEEVVTMFSDIGGFVAEAGTDFQPTKLFKIISKMYRKLGLPEEVIGIMDNMTDVFGELFVGIGENSSQMEQTPMKLMKVFAGLMEKLGMPPALSSLCTDIGNMLNGTAEPTPELMLNIIQKTMTSLGLPEAVTNSMGTIMQSLNQGEVPDLTKLLGPMLESGGPEAKELSNGIQSFMNSMTSGSTEGLPDLAKMLAPGAAGSSAGLRDLAKMFAPGASGSPDPLSELSKIFSPNAAGAGGAAMPGSPDPLSELSKIFSPNAAAAGGAAMPGHFASQGHSAGGIADLAKLLAPPAKGMPGGGDAAAAVAGLADLAKMFAPPPPPSAARHAAGAHRRGISTVAKAPNTQLLQTEEPVVEPHPMAEPLEHMYRKVRDVTDNAGGSPSRKALFRDAIAPGLMRMMWDHTRNLAQQRFPSTA